jgi:hypothetical protein
MYPSLPLKKQLERLKMPDFLLTERPKVLFSKTAVLKKD